MNPDIHIQAHGRWPSILLSIGVSESYLTGKHGPCFDCGGRDRFRFDDKNGTGSFYCSKCGAGSGLDFVMRFTGTQFKEAVKLVREKLPCAAVAPAKKKADEAETKKLLKKTWEEAALATKTDATGLYLAGRHLTIPKGCKSLRTHPGLDWRDSDGKVQGNFPCMLAAIVDRDGNPSGIHRTWLKDGKQAPVDQPKKSLGKILPSCAIRLFPIQQTLAVAEGIETALAVNALFGYPCWSLISAGQFEKFTWPAGIKNLAIFGDSDLSFTGQKSAYILAYRAKAEGLSVTVRLPDGTDRDWADVLHSNVHGGMVEK